MEIPTNTYNPQTKIDSIVSTLINDLQEHNGTYAACPCKGASLPLEIIPALKQFKAKGWFTYYYMRFDGVILDVQIYRNHYTPSNRGLNQLIEY